MPRTSRASQGGYSYHVLNLGNARSQVFHKPADFAAFLAMIGESSVRLPMRLLGYGSMPNHFHLILRPHHDGDLSRRMQWLLTTHVRRYLRGRKGDILFFATSIPYFLKKIRMSPFPAPMMSFWHMVLKI